MYIIIPLYRGANLVPGLVSSLTAVSDEIRQVGAEVLFINDSPDDVELREALDSFLLPATGSFRFRLLLNETNQGFIRSCNRGLALCIEERRDALLLNSDALLTPGALAEMMAAAETDPMIGFVGPRSNNATISNLPIQDSFRHASLPLAVEAHRQLARHLPRVTYTPTAVGFCLLIKALMLLEFGLLDEAYGLGYNEENDFIMRSNRRGFRSVLANRAFVYHIGSVSFSLTPTSSQKRDEENFKMLNTRYPEYLRGVGRYFDSPAYHAEAMLTGLYLKEGEKPRVLFECSNLGDYFNGTFELTVKGVRAFAERFAAEYDIYLVCNLEAYSFHRIADIKGVTYLGEVRHAFKLAPFRYVVRLAQPFSLDELHRFARLAPIVSVMMLDTIGYDCLYIDDFDVAGLWRRFPQMVDAIGYISTFSRDQFLRRFDVPDHVVNFVALLSTETREYGRTPEGRQSLGLKDGFLFVVGNHYHHKNLDETVHLLRAFHPEREIVVLGALRERDYGEKVHSFPSGAVTDAGVREMYARCSAVVFPSFYEGFGFPMVHGLAFEKPVLARDTPVAREIRARSRGGANIHLFQTTRELASAAGEPVRWVREDNGVEAQSWRHFAEAVDGALKEAEERFDFARFVKRFEATQSGQEPAGVMHPATVISLVLSRHLEKALRAAARFKPLRLAAQALWKRRHRFRRLAR